eukprot:TRINITY_DN4618_c0_g1_i1.p1 TRINITY_DN4618_c0_g1~~TRINITY_DN4618_c0_g1_i1.p1  ORF type:complete len:432 (+),score=91.12 TRINITY_DN4618_c0_g1_i1:74-1369(+)
MIDSEPFKTFQQTISQVDEAFESADEKIASHFSIIAKDLDSLSESIISECRSLGTQGRKASSEHEATTMCQMTNLQSLLHLKSRRWLTKSLHIPSIGQSILRHLSPTSSTSDRHPYTRTSAPISINLSSITELQHPFQASRLIRQIFLAYPQICPPPPQAFPNCTTPSISCGGDHNKPFRRPWGLAIHPRDGRVFVTDQWNHRVLILSPFLEPIATFGRSFGNKEEMSYPCGISISLDGRVAVADYDPKRIIILTDGGQFMTFFVPSSTELYSELAPFMVAFDSKGHLWVCCDKSDQLRVYDKEYKLLRSITVPNPTNQNTVEPHGIICNDRNEMIVSLKAQDTVLVFDEDGTMIRTIPINCTEKTGVNWLGYGPNGSFVICNENDDRMEYYDADGRLIHARTTPKPLGVAFSPAGRLYHTSTSANQVYML